MGRRHEFKFKGIRTLNWSCFSFSLNQLNKNVHSETNVSFYHRGSVAFHSFLPLRGQKPSFDHSQMCLAWTARRWQSERKISRRLWSAFSQTSHSIAPWWKQSILTFRGHQVSIREERCERGNLLLKVVVFLPQLCVLLLQCRDLFVCHLVVLEGELKMVAKICFVVRR